ncbi:MAG: sugar ABC transporter permease [Treponema sp.]|nr:sugar ABC transporter permease [Treponema sp.]
MTMTAKQRSLRNNLVAYSFIAPNFIGFAVFTLGPIIFAFVLAFLKWNGSGAITFAGLSNFKKLATDPSFKAALVNTIIYSVGTVPLTMVFSLLLAIILNRKIFGRNFFRTVSFFPYVASLVAVAVVWNMLFNPAKGPINMLLTYTHISEQHVYRTFGRIKKHIPNNSNCNKRCYRRKKAYCSKKVASKYLTIQYYCK